MADQMNVPRLLRWAVDGPQESGMSAVAIAVLDLAWWADPGGRAALNRWILRGELHGSSRLASSRARSRARRAVIHWARRSAFSLAGARQSVA